jgi:hypothetical protein
MAVLHGQRFYPTRVEAAVILPAYLHILYHLERNNYFVDHPGG